MDKKSKVLIIIFIIAVFISIFFTYKRSFVDRNFLIIEEEEVATEEIVEKRLTEEIPSEEIQ